MTDQYRSWDASGSITTGGTAQLVAGGFIPVHGQMILNPDATNDLWVSNTTTATPNGAGCLRIAANGGYYATEVTQKPAGPLSVYGAVTGQKFTCQFW